MSRQSATVAGGLVTETRESAPSLDAASIYDLLSNDRRRYTMTSLLATGEPVTVRTLSRDLAAWENDVEPEEVTPSQRKRVYTALHQTHLVRLDAFGVVDYDRNRGRVVPTEVLETVFRPLLVPAPATTDRPRSHLVGLGVAGLGLGAGSLLGLPVLGQLPVGVGAVLLGGALLGLTALEGRWSDEEEAETEPLGYIESLEPSGHRESGVRQP